MRTWDQWSFNDCDKLFGDDEWPGRIPAQLIAHILYYFSEQNDLVFDPMGGGGVTPDTCLAFNRRCRTLDMIDRPDKRPEIEPKRPPHLPLSMQTGGIFRINPLFVKLRQILSCSQDFGENRMAAHSYYSGAFIIGEI